jgi:hypothetical protein
MTSVKYVESLMCITISADEKIETKKPWEVEYVPAGQIWQLPKAVDPIFIRQDNSASRSLIEMETLLLICIVAT